MLILAGSSDLHICLCQWFLRFVAILFFIDLSFSFRILCRYRICFSCIIVSTSHIPVSTWTISRGVVLGVFRILLSVLLNIFYNCSISAFVGIHASAAYVIIGIIHVSTSFQTTFSSVVLCLWS